MNSVKYYIKIWSVAFTFFIIIDLIWLGFIARPVYRHFLDNLLAEQTNWGAAIMFYILFVAGLVYFAILPSLREKKIKIAVKNGALYGFFTYMTYELTNLAVIKDWPIGIVPIDIVWGVILGCSVASISSWFTLKYLR